MKTIAFILFSLLVWQNIQAQSYEDAIRKGDKELVNGNFKKAINLYFAAEAINPEKKDEVQKKVNHAFDEIEKLRQEM